MSKKRKRYIYVTEEQVRQAALDLERQENMDLEQEIAEANAWAEANHIVRRPFPEVPPPKRRPVRQILRPRRDNTVQIAKKSRFKPYIQLAAVFIIVILGGWYTQTDAVQGMRLDLVNLFTNEVRDKGTIILNHDTDLNEIYLPEYLPAAFKLLETEKTAFNCTMTYGSQNEWISIIQPFDQKAFIYLEDSNQLTDLTVLNKYRASLYVQNGIWYITWFDDHSISIMVMGNTDIEEGKQFINNLIWSKNE